MSQILTIPIDTVDVPMFKYALKELEMDVLALKEVGIGKYHITFEIASPYTLISIGKMIGIKIAYDKFREPGIQMYNEIKKVIDDATKSETNVG